MGAVITVLIVLACSVTVVRFATVGLTMTGLSRDLAHFQALSAFTGSGFTTRESEDIVNHPVRRRIVMHLMLLGNAGIVIAMASVLLSFLNTSRDGNDWSAVWWYRLLVLSAGIAVLWLIASSRHYEQATWRINQWALSKWGSVELHDYTRLLRFSRNYVVWELHVQPGNWLAGKTLAESQLANEGVLILGIERANGDYIGAPRGRTRIEANDQLIIYGQQETLADLDTRQPGMMGNLHHVIAVTRQLDVLDKEGRLGPPPAEDVASTTRSNASSK